MMPQLVILLDEHAEAKIADLIAARQPFELRGAELAIGTTIAAPVARVVVEFEPPPTCSSCGQPMSAGNLCSTCTRYAPAEEQR